jgi:type I restriction enzyme R subunit
VKGRGTRKYNFRYIERQGGHTEEHVRAKEKFKLFDFCANCEYFEEKFNYDEVLALPPLRPGKPGGEPLPLPQAAAGYENVEPDPLKSQIEYAVPVYGMKIDRKFFEKFEEQVKAAPEVRERHARGDVKGAEDAVIATLFNKPEDFFNLEKLRRAVQVDRRITLREILAKAFGEIDRFKTRDEMLEDEIAVFVSIHKPDAAAMPAIRQFFKAYVTDGGLRTIIDSREFSRLADNPKVSLADVKALGPWRDVIPEYVKDYVPLNAYM